MSLLLVFSSSFIFAFASASDSFSRVDCPFLRAGESPAGVGWLCCKNVTLSVESGHIVGTRGYVTPRCAAFVASFGGARAEVSGLGRVSLHAAIIVACSSATLISFAVACAVSVRACCRLHGTRSESFRSANTLTLSSASSGSSGSVVLTRVEELDHSLASDWV